MRYIFEAGKPRRVMHISKHDYLGRELMEAVCGINHRFDRTINAPFALGRKLCKNCLRKLEE